MLEQTATAIQVSCTVLADSESLREALEKLPGTPRDFERFASAQQSPWLDLNAPLTLQPVYIAKPWGREVWYSAIEARGQSRVAAQDFTMPLPWLLALFPFVLSDQASPAAVDDLILLKILDPLPDEVYGDLYFEAHDEKREVYIVTAIDRQAWPQQQGAIRLGFDQTLRASFADDIAFRQAYLQAVRDYRHIRTAIDEQFDAWRVADGIGLNEPVPASVLKRWQQQLPDVLQQQEHTLRSRMDSFTALQPLQVGDVVRIPCGVPHALQHGVRTVEFQTPVYERKILSFAQKVLTQPHWDTESVLDSISIESPEAAILQTVSSKAGQYLLEQVAAFDDFVVQRLTLHAGQAFDFTGDGHYALLLLIDGQLGLRADSWSRQLTGENMINPALIVPAAVNALQLRAGATDAIVLIARPVIIASSSADVAPRLL